MLFRALIRRRERVEPEAEAAEEVLGPEPLEPTTSAVLPRKPRPVFGNPFRRRG